MASSPPWSQPNKIIQIFAQSQPDREKGEERERESKAFAVSLTLLLSSLSTSTETRKTVYFMPCEVSRIKLKLQLHGQFTFYLAFSLKGEFAHK